MRIYLLFAVLHLCYIGFAQTSKINYGNNKAAGKYYNIRGFKMYCETYGSGKPLLLIHGNGGSIQSFENNIPYFAKKYKLIIADSRAQGKSTDTNDSLSFEMMADDESAFLDSMHLDSVFVLGWSDGGIVALLLAMRHPDKVIKLAATGANLWPDSTAIVPAVWMDGKKQYDADKDNILNTPKEKNDWKLFMLDWLQPDIALSDLKQIQCPALIMAGDHDVIRTEHILQIYQNIPNAYLWILPNSSHSTLVDHKDEFNKKVDDFFVKPFYKW